MIFFLGQTTQAFDSAAKASIDRSRLESHFVGDGLQRPTEAIPPVNQLFLFRIELGQPNFQPCNSPLGVRVAAVQACGSIRLRFLEQALLSGFAAQQVKRDAMGHDSDERVELLCIGNRFHASHRLEHGLLDDIEASAFVAARRLSSAMKHEIEVRVVKEMESVGVSRSHFCSRLRPKVRRRVGDSLGVVNRFPGVGQYLLHHSY